MKIDKLFLNNKIFDCYLAIFNACIYNKGFDYNLLYKYAWNFDFNQDESFKNKLVGGYIDIDTNIHLQLDKYNITTTDIPVDNIKTIQDKLNNNESLICSFDTYYCPWLPDYGQIHSGHSTLLISINDEYIECKDLVPYRENIYFPINKFSESNMQIYKINVPKQNLLIDTITELKEVYEYIRKDNCIYFINMQEWAKAINNYFDLSKEQLYQDIDWIFGNPFYKDILYIVRSRNLFNTYLYYLSKKNHIIDILYNSFSEICSFWEVTWGLVLKKLVAKIPMNEFKLFLYSRILKGIDLEKKCFTLLETVCNSFNTEEIHKPQLELETKKQINVDISTYFNNRAFSKTIENKEKADFTNTGEYFISDEKKSENIYDNISCSEQKIKIDRQMVKTIEFYGCSEFGDFSDKVIVYNNKIPIKSKTLKLSEWIKIILDEDDIVYKTYPAYIINSRKIESKTIPANIYSRTIVINDIIDKIELPNCPNMHIFNIYINI